MNQLSHRVIGFGIAVAMLTGSVTMRADQAPPTNVPGIDKPVIVVTNEITGTENWTSNYYYVLRGAVFVREGATLNIQAGTRVIGEAGLRCRLSDGARSRALTLPQWNDAAARLELALAGVPQST